MEPMTSPTGKPGFYRFGVFEVKPAAGELLRKGVRVKLQEQPFRLLCLLLEKSGGIVSKEDVRERLWPGNTFVEFDASLSVAVGKLRDALGDDAENPRFIETVPRRGYRFLAPIECVSQEPLVAESPILSPNSVLALPALPTKVSTIRIKQAVLIFAVAILLVGVIVFRSFRRQSASTAEAKSSAGSPQIRKSIAVLGFRNLPGRQDEDWLSQAFTEMVSTELAAGGALRVVPDEDVARVKREFPIGNGETLARSTLERLRTNPGADVIVVGSYTTLPSKTGDRIRLDIRLQDTANGETISEDAVTGSKADLFELATRAGSHLRESLGMGVLSPDSGDALQASLPANQTAIRFYSEGKAKLWDFDYVGAKDLLIKAVDADPNYPLAHAALSDVLGHLGYGLKATEEAKRALDLSGHLPQSEKLLIEASYWELSGNLPKAIEVYRSLFQLHPDSLEYGLYLATAQYQVQPADALATLKILRQLPAPSGDDPRIDLLEASAQVTQNVAAGQAAAKRAAAKGTALGSHLMVARAYGILCQQGVALGVSTEETISDCEKGIESAVSAGDRYNAARTLNDLAGTYYQQGDLHKAESMWREASREFRHNGAVEGLAATSNNIGDVYLKQGLLREAKRMLEDSIPNYQAAGDKSGVALALSDIAELSRMQGNLGSAETTYQQAKAAANEVNDKNALAYVESGLGDVLMDRGDLAAARKSYEESLAIAVQMGEKQVEGQIQVALAVVSMEEGHPADAENALRKWKEQFHSEKQADDELTAYIGLIQTLLAQSKVAEAKLEREHAEPLAARSQSLLARLQFELVSAQVVAALGDLQSASRSMEATLRQVREHGYLGMEFECRLALAELQKKSGHVAASQEELASLEKAAQAKGFGLMARKAFAARS
jgi:eukaryotic-like serine/threonine-protein kinase